MTPPRVIVVRPGPAFSVQEVSRGWAHGFVENGCQVVDFNLDERLYVYNAAHHHDGDGQPCRKMFTPTEAVRCAANGIKNVCWDFLPDLIFIVSAFYIPADIMQELRVRGTKVVILHTESPYEDDNQVQRAEFADYNLINDPTHLERFRAVAPTDYQHHCYDPAVNHPREPLPEHLSDFAFVGTGFKSRVDLFEAVDWTGIDFTLAGNWQATRRDSPLREHMAHDIARCCDNLTETQQLYAGTKASANLYRREANEPALAEGWSMGPREVELAASGTFFLRDPRGEGDEVLDMLPTFKGPEEFEAVLRHWLEHDDSRALCAEAARAAIADRTFANSARRLLTHLGL